MGNLLLGVNVVDCEPRRLTFALIGRGSRSDPKVRVERRARQAFQGKITVNGLYSL